jgi:hypothetical protein
MIYSWRPSIEIEHGVYDQTKLCHTKNFIALRTK